MKKILTVAITVYPKHYKYILNLKKIEFNPRIEYLLINNSKKDIPKKIYIPKFFLVLKNKTKEDISGSRNISIKKSNAKYITFIDCDDDFYIDKINLKLLQEKNYKIIIYKHSTLAKNKKLFTEDFKLNKGHIFKRKFDKFIKNYLSLPRGNSILTHVWSKLYNVNFLRKNNLKFRKGWKVNEDLLFNSLALLKAKAFYYEKRNIFYYHNQANFSKTMLRHLNKKFIRSYREPGRNFSLIIKKSDRKKYNELFNNYWAGKINFLLKFM